MVKQRLFVISIFLLLLITTMGISSASTIVAGKIYSLDYSSNIAGADVHVQCGSDYLDTTSLADGTYGVKFADDECNVSTAIYVTSTKSGFEGKTASDTFTKCVGVGCIDIAIVNIGMSVATSGGGGGGGGGGSSTRYYLCGNGVCNSGETTATCPGDCPAVQSISLLNNNTEVEENETETQEKQSNTNFLTGSAIAGFTEFATSGKGMAIIAGIVILIIGGVIFFKFKDKFVKKK